MSLFFLAGDPIIPNWRAEFARLEGAYAPATIKSYYTDVGIFVAWCARNSVEPFPADPATVGAFLEDQAPLLAVATVRRRIAELDQALLRQGREAVVGRPHADADAGRQIPLADPRVLADQPERPQVDLLLE